MNSYNYNAVKEFHERFGAHIEKTPTLPDEATRKLRRDIIDEEHEEFKQAEANDDIVEIADALADLVYVIYGTAISYGIPLDQVITEVHRSNMSKLDQNGEAIVSENGKVQKSDLYFPPNIKGIIDSYKNNKGSLNDE